MLTADNRHTSASADVRTMIGDRSTDYLTTASAEEIGIRRSENYNFAGWTQNWSPYKKRMVEYGKDNDG